MNLSAISSSLIAAAQGGQSSPALQRGGTDADGDNDGSSGGGRGGRVGRGGSGSAILQALQQALASLGLQNLSPTAAKGSASAAVPTSTAASPSSSTDGSQTLSAATVRADLHQFMHALMQAVKSAASQSTASTADAGTSNAATAPAGGRSARFSGGLSALISQMTGGTAPQGLQDAFSKLVTDLQATQGGTPAAASPTDSSASSSNSAALLKFLQTLQQDLGYGQSPESSGTLVNTQA